MSGIYLEYDASVKSHLLAYSSNLFVILIVTSYTLLSTEFIVYADKTAQIEQIMYALLQCANGASTLCGYLTLIPERRTAVTLTKTIQSIVNKRRCTLI